MKIIEVIFGALLVASGAYCLLSPVQTFAAIGWVVGVSMIFEGFTSIMTWGVRQRLGFADGWTLAGAILSVVLGLVVVVSDRVQFSLDAFFAYVVALWLVFGGITRIIAALGLRKLGKDNELVGRTWIVALLVGLLVLAAGVACILHPMITMASLGMLIGIGIIVSGCSHIAVGLSL